MPGGAIDFERLVRSSALMHDLADGPNHAAWTIALKDVSAHIDASRALLYSAIGHRQRVEFRQLFAARHHHRYRTRGGDGFEAILDIVGLDEVRAEFSADAAGQAQVARVAHHLLANGGDAHHRHAVAQPHIDQACHTMYRARLKLAADENLYRQRADVQA